jgi:putative flippase GtrA
MSTQAPRPRGAAANPVVRQFLTYNLVGIIVAAVDFSIFTLISLGPGIFYLNAHLVSRSVGGVSGFFLHRNVTFRRQRSGTLAREGWRFVIVYAVSFALSSLLLVFWVGIIRVQPLAGKALAEGAVLVVNFLVLRHWGFR